MRSIAIYNNKGGVGKTTLAANIAYNLSAQGHSVLMIDCDPQGNLSQFYRQQDLRKSNLADALAGDTNCAMKTAHRNLNIIQCNDRCEGITWCDTATFEQMLNCYNEDYDYCLIDCAPSSGVLSSAAINAADVVLIPMLLSNYSIAGIDTTLSKMYDKDKAYVVINGYAATKACKQMLSDLVQQYSYQICRNVVRYSTMVHLAEMTRKPLAKKSRVHGVTIDIKKLTEEVAEYAGA